MVETVLGIWMCFALSGFVLADGAASIPWQVTGVKKECTPFRPEVDKVRVSMTDLQVRACTSLAAYGVAFAWQRDSGDTQEKVMRWAYRIGENGRKTATIPTVGLARFERLAEYVFHERNAKTTWQEMDGCVFLMCALGGFDIRPPQSGDGAGIPKKD